MRCLEEGGDITAARGAIIAQMSVNIQGGPETRGILYCDATSIRVAKSNEYTLMMCVVFASPSGG